MIFKANDLPAEQREHMRGGQGAVEVAQACPPAELPKGLRLHAKLTLPAGASIGEHVHAGETELFYVLRGRGEMLQDGAWLPLGPGDATSTGGGQAHSLRNAGDEPFVVMATIIEE